MFPFLHLLVTNNNILNFFGGVYFILELSCASLLYFKNYKITLFYENSIAFFPVAMAVAIVFFLFEYFLSFSLFNVRFHV
jgi:hypothetical protein